MRRNLRQDADGYLYFVSRKKDISRRGGLNIAASEVESVLRDAFGVRDAAVIAKPHPVLGEDLCAFVEPSVAVTVDDIREHCRRYLADYKVPRDIRLVANLPRNAMARVIKSDLRQLL